MENKSAGKLGIVLMGVFVTLVMGLFVLEVVQIQLVGHDMYVDERNKQFSVEREIPAARGEILLSDGTPIVRNRTVSNVVIDKAYLPTEGQNEVYIKLASLLNITGEQWVDTLPITKTAPFEFIQGEGAEEAVAKLKITLEKQDYATVDDVLDKLYQIYEIGDEYSDDEKRLLIGIRYEMAMQNFSVKYPFTFAEDVKGETILKLREASVYFPGVTTEERTIREYTNGTFAPHLWGTVGPIYKEDAERYKELGYAMNETVGKGGLEEAFEDELRGDIGISKIIRDTKGNVISEEIISEPVPGNTVQTTLIPEIQLVAQQSLEATILNLQKNGKVGEGREAKSGAVVAIDNDTGNILAMAQYPSFDLQEYRSRFQEISKSPGNPLFNRVLFGQYAPGSCYKPMISTAAISEGQINASSTVFCNHVYTFYEGYRPECLGTHGNTTVLKALQKSCNIFFYDTGRILGIETINRYATSFGLAQPTGIEVPEALGELASPETKEKHGQNWVPGDVVQASIGQGGNVFSPLQIANYAATIARDGVLKETHLISQITNYNGTEVVSKTEPVTLGVIPNQNNNFQIVKEGMIMATEPGGTSFSYIGRFPFQIASKTGTPQTSLTTQNSVYICFPINPEGKGGITIVAIIEDGWHGYTSAPVAKDIFNAYYFGNYSGYNVDFGIPQEITIPAEPGAESSTPGAPPAEVPPPVEASSPSSEEEESEENSIPDWVIPEPLWGGDA